MMGFGFSGMLFSGLLMVAFWVLIIGGAVWLIFMLAHNNQGVSTTTTLSGQTPLAILQARYAKGEITKEQFDQMRHALGA